MNERIKKRDGLEKRVILCDPEEEYARLMTEYLRKQKDLPWELATYTDTEELLDKEREAVTLLVVAESAYREELRALSPKGLVVLSESGVLRWEQLRYVNKYQRADGVLNCLLEVYMEVEETIPIRLGQGCGTVLIGNYSPVRRGMQTSLALALGQMLSEDHATLYLNFEHFAGLPELVADLQTCDMADLLYFLHLDKEKFRLRFRTIKKQIGKLDYVPPMKSGQNLLSVTAAEWLALLQKIEELGEYEYVILDLSESMQGLFQILRRCRQIFTVTREDRIAQCKLLQYEQLLSLCAYEDVWQKTKQLCLSHIRRLPEDLEQLTKGELASLVRQLMTEILKGGEPA